MSGSRQEGPTVLFFEDGASAGKAPRKSLLALPERAPWLAVGLGDLNTDVVLASLDCRHRPVAAVVVTDDGSELGPTVTRQIFVASLLRAPDLILAVGGGTSGNQAAASRLRRTEQIERIEANLKRIATPLGFRRIIAVEASSHTDGSILRGTVGSGSAAVPKLLEALADAGSNALPAREAPFRMVCQGAATLADAGPRVQGTVLAGMPAIGDVLVVARTGETAVVVGLDAPSEIDGQASPRAAVGLLLDKPVTTDDGEIIALARARPDVADQFAAHILWLGREPLLPARRYRMTLAGKSALASVTDLRHAIDLTDLGRIPATLLQSGDIGFCNLAASEPLAFDPFADSPGTGVFELRDSENGNRLGIGFVEYALRRATNIQIQSIAIDKARRADIKSQTPRALWFTGLSGAGKTTIANRVEQRLVEAGRHTYMLDGDNLRHGLNKDLGFKAADRVENVRRVGEVTKLMLDAGLIVLVSLISPFRSERQSVRDLLAPGEFVEIHVDASLDTCRKRDPKGLYKKADAGLIANFTGISSPYEAPLSPDILLDADRLSPDELADVVMIHLRRIGS